MTFRPAPFLEGRRAALATGLLLAVNLLLLIVFFAKPVAGSTFFLFVISLLLWLPILYLAWRAWACFTLAYWIDRNAITVVYGPVRQTIPLGDIREIRRGEAVAAWQAGAPPVQGPNGEADWAVDRLVRRWPDLARWVCYGPELGTRRTLHGRRVNSLASLPLSEQILLVTAGRTFGISPDDPDRFLDALDDFHQLGPTHLVEQARHWPAVARWPLWQDQVLLGLLAAGFVGFLVLLGVAIFRFTGLPYALPLWDNLDRRLIFVFPAFGLAVWLVNGAWGLLVHRRHRIAAALLFGGAVAAQLAALAALLSVTRG
ncbi:MAG: hypothetical protein R2844_04700 [Caldilineales bacterium]